MKRLLPLVLVICAAIGCTPKHNLEIRLKGFHNDTLILGVMPLSDYIANNYDNMQTQTLVAQDGVIKTNIQTDDSAKYFQLIATQLSVREGRMSLPTPAGIIRNFITSNDKIRMEVTPFDKHIEVAVKSGSRANRDIADVRNQYRKLAADYFALLIGDKGQQLSRVERGVAIQNSLNAMDNALIESIKSNPDRVSSLFLLFNLTLLPDDIVKYIEHLKPTLLSHEWEDVNALYEKTKQMCAVRCKAKRMIDENGAAFDFTSKDINGNEFTLSSLRGKWVVLDFWGSWCGPCMRGVPMMKRYYDRYRSNMEIVGIACNDKQEQWRKAIEKNEMSWINIFHPDDTLPANSIMMNYAVTNFPTKVIITPEGRLHKVFVGETEDFYTEIDDIMK